MCVYTYKDCPEISHVIVSSELDVSKYAVASGQPPRAPS